MSNSKLFVLLFAIFFCLTQVQRNHIYFMHYTRDGVNTLDHKLTQRLPRIELETNSDEFLIFNEKRDIQNPNKML